MGVIILIALLIVFVLSMTFLFVYKFTGFPDRILFNRLNKNNGIRTTGKTIDVINGPGRFHIGSDKVGVQALIFMIEFRATNGKTYRNKYKTNLTSFRWIGKYDIDIPVIYDEDNPKIMTLDKTYYLNKEKALKEQERERKKAFDNLEN
jgi:hypothetical protein